jgi:DNA-directed RNA polymerase subunit beta'
MWHRIAQWSRMIVARCSGVEVEPLLEGGEVIQRLSERILGRTTVNDVLDPFTDEVVVRAGREIDENDAQKIENAGVTTVLIRSA